MRQPGGNRYKKKRKSYHSRVNTIVLVLTLLLAGICAFYSMQSKDETPDEALLAAAGAVLNGAESIDIADIEATAVTRWLEQLWTKLLGLGEARPVAAITDDNLLTVHFIDIGQGKSILVQNGSHTALIDVGENGMGTTVIDYLKRQNVQAIDLLVGTHPHSDHIGDMDEIIKKFPIGQLLMPDVPEAIIPTSRTYLELLTAIDEYDVDLLMARPGQKFALGDMRFTVLGPVRDYDDLNNISVVLRLDYGGHTFLFTGDMEKAAEKDVLASGRAVAADVLDVAHHGSATSSHKDFLDAVKPQIAVISCGIDNSYGHPVRSVVESIADRGADIFRTDLDGTVVITSDGKALTVDTQK